MSQQLNTLKSLDEITSEKWHPTEVVLGTKSLGTITCSHAAYKEWKKKLKPKAKGK